MRERTITLLPGRKPAPVLALRQVSGGTELRKVGAQNYADAAVFRQKVGAQNYAKRRRAQSVI